LSALHGKSRRLRKTCQVAAVAALVAAGLLAYLEPPFESHAERGMPLGPGIAALTPPDDETPPADRPGEAEATAEDAAPAQVERVVEARRGDTFMKLMLGAGVDRGEAHAAIDAMKGVFNPRDLRPGLAVTVTFTPEGEKEVDRRFDGFRFDAEADRAVVVMREDTDGFRAEAIERELDSRKVRAAGEIESNLYTAAQKAGLPAGVLVELIRLYSWDVDFQRDIQPGDRFDVMVERMHYADGEVARWGDIVYAELTLSGQKYPLYRFKGARGDIDYFDASGQSAQKALMKTPIDGARLSSGFGRRKHPILGYTRVHQGVDFAAPSGTPIYAAGNGSIEQIGRNGGYGKYIRIRHNGRFDTAYAHMSRFASGLKRGSRVRQGQVIGYVGTTGRSTGPHLHYEIHVEGRQTNPMRLKLPSGRKLKGSELIAFRALQETRRDQLAAIPPISRVANR
jgi:murein DD-endopeptidase MepM/ murein hydrolase activator NlpD